jgi:hypothetical protein
VPISSTAGRPAGNRSSCRTLSLSIEIVTGGTVRRCTEYVKYIRLDRTILARFTLRVPCGADGLFGATAQPVAEGG